MPFKRIFLLLFLCCTNAQVNFTSKPCSNRNPKIVGGITANMHEIPFIVSLRRRGSHFCAGSIIHERWILTAAHCVCNGLNKVVKPTQLDGVIGLHNTTEYVSTILSLTPGSNQAVTVQFINIYTHPQYCCEKVKNDIALLKSKQNIIFNSHIQPCCLDFIAKTNEYAMVFGWGWTQENRENGIRPEVLQKATVRIWNNDECQKSYAMNSNAKNFRISDRQVCAGFEDGLIDSCWADSGGPLITKEYMLIGIVSTGIGCARPGLPGVYTRVGVYLDWIHSVITEEI